MTDKALPPGEFQKIIEILVAIKNTVDSKTDVVWTKFDSSDELISDLDKKINRLQSSDYDTLADVYLMFLPTGTYQELSISNGWADNYIVLSEQFDYYYKIIKSKRLS